MVVFKCGAYLVAYGAVFKEHKLWTPSLRFPSALLQLSSISQKRTYTPLWSPKFCDCHPGDISKITWFWQPVSLMLVVPQDCIYLHTSKSRCLRVWLPVSLNLGAEILPLGH